MSRVKIAIQLEDVNPGLAQESKLAVFRMPGDDGPQF
jgi:hypothetical protein